MNTTCFCCMLQTDITTTSSSLLRLSVGLTSSLLRICIWVVAGYCLHMLHVTASLWDARGLNWQPGNENWLVEPRAENVHICIVCIVSFLVWYWLENNFSAPIPPSFKDESLTSRSVKPAETVGFSKFCVLGFTFYFNSFWVKRRK